MDEMPDNEFLSLPPDPLPTLLPPLLKTEQGVERLQPLLKLLEEDEGESPIMMLLAYVGEALALLDGLHQRLERVEQRLTTLSCVAAPAP